MNAQIELGIIFIVNFPFGEFTDDNDPEHVKTRLLDFKTGYFNYSQYKYNDKAKIFFISSFSGLDKNPNSPNTRVSKLVLKSKENVSVSDVYTEEEVINFGAVNLGNKDVLSMVLSYTLSQMRARRYILFFYNHSSAFGLFKNKADESSQVKMPSVFIDRNVRFFDTISKSSESQSFFTADELIIGNNDTGFLKNMDFLGFRKSKTKIKIVRKEEIRRDFKDDMLTNSELLVAIQAALRLNSSATDSDKFEIIFSAGCYFLNMDLAYTLKDVSKFLVGAQGIMPPPSYDYPSIINKLFEELESKKGAENIDYKEAVNVAIRGFGKNKFYEKTDTVKKWLRATYITALDCSMIDKLTALFNDFILVCFSESETLIPEILKILVEADDLSIKYNQSDSPFHLLDFNFFISKLSISKKNTDKALEIYAKIFETLKDLNCFENFSDPDFPSIKNNFRGISFYFPPTLSTALKSYSFPTFYSSTTLTPSFFASETFWVDFLNFYYKFLLVKLKISEF